MPTFRRATPQHRHRAALAVCEWVKPCCTVAARYAAAARPVPSLPCADQRPFHQRCWARRSAELCVRCSKPLGVRPHAGTAQSSRGAGGRCIAGRRPAAGGADVVHADVASPGQGSSVSPRCLPLARPAPLHLLPPTLAFVGVSSEHGRGGGGVPPCTFFRHAPAYGGTRTASCVAGAEP